MPETPIAIRIGEAPELEALLSQRLYEYNAAALNRFDGESFSAAQYSATGSIEGGVHGYTWAGCCFLSYLWVDERVRGTGLGSSLLAAAELHASEQGCALVILSTHSFQAPGFYLRRGYTQVAEVPDHPVGHSNLFFSKRLPSRS